MPTTWEFAEVEGAGVQWKQTATSKSSAPQAEITVGAVVAALFEDAHGVKRVEVNRSR